MTSTSGGQRNIWLSHTFPQPTKGTLSVWFYDTAPGQYTLYAGLYAYDSTDSNTNNFSLDVADWNPSNYVWYGPPNPSPAATSVSRTLGWHEFTIRVTSTGFDALIDQASVGSASGDFAFDTVMLLVSGPGGAPNCTFYFDDFRFTPPVTVPKAKDECKDGGWQHLSRADGSSFKNQGACVSYVNTGK